MGIQQPERQVQNGFRLHHRLECVVSPSFDRHRRQQRGLGHLLGTHLRDGSVAGGISPVARAELSQPNFGHAGDSLRVLVLIPGAGHCRPVLHARQEPHGAGHHPAGASGAALGLVLSLHSGRAAVEQRSRGIRRLELYGRRIRIIGGRPRLDPRVQEAQLLVRLDQRRHHRRPHRP